MVARRTFRYQVEAGFDLRLTLFGHGWIDLSPFRWDEAEAKLEVAVPLGASAVDLTAGMRRGALVVSAVSARPLSATRAATLRALLPSMLRLDQDLQPFWDRCAGTPWLAWVAERRAGRILRGATVFEDLFKLLFTTNCSWAATRLMASRLVEALGAKAPSGYRAFPSAAACAEQDESFYREQIRVGYRAASCRRIAAAFAEGEVDEAWFTDPDLPVDVARERLLALPGFGPYAAGQALRLFGHYKDLALDSWCRGRLAEMAGRRKAPSDQAVARRYAAFDPYDGLALWMDLTAAWHGQV